MVSKALTTFDYAQLGDGEAKGKLIYLAGEIRKTVSQHQKSGLAIGESVAQAHAILAGEGREGQFAAWVETECGFSRTTAYNYMWTWGRFGESKYIDRYEPAALYLLASPKVPEAAVKEAEKLASKGHIIRLEDAKELKEKHTAPKTSVQPLNTLSPCATTPGAEKKPQPSVTGTSTSTPGEGPPSLPSVGTVNRTEQGSQGDGGAGECPRGGKCDRDDTGTCVKCKDPPIPEVIPLDTSADFDPANIEAHKASLVANLEARMKAHNLELERYAKRIAAAFENDRPESAWLNDSQLGIVGDSIRSALQSVRVMKCDQICPKCGGTGKHTGKPCKWCRGVGFMPQRSYEMAGGQ